MNNERRKKIKKVIESLQKHQQNIESIMDEENEFLDNAPENLAESERYEKSQNAIDYLTDAIDNIDEAIGSLEEAQD